MLDTGLSASEVNVEEIILALGRTHQDHKLGTYVQVVVHLGHYLYAMRQLYLAASTGRSTSFFPTFYLEALWNMLGNWFSIRGRSGNRMLGRALADLGLEELLGPLDQLLDSPVGSTTWRDIVREVRNAQGTHEVFRGNVQLHVCEKLGIDPMTVSVKGPDFLNEMGGLVSVLYLQVEEALRAYDRECYDVLRRYGLFYTGLEEL